MRTWDVKSKSAATYASELAEPAALLREGGLVAFPTETVYGLGANALLDEAVKQVFVAKGRPSDNPLIVHIADREMLSQVVHPNYKMPRAVQIAMDSFWPGPLTLILPAHPEIAPTVRPGMDTIGIRMPNHPVALALLRAANCPVAAPSANLSGKPSPTRAEDVMEDMQGRIAGVVDGGACNIGVESTVVNISAHEAVIYRPGGISQEALQRILPVPVKLDAHLQTPDEAPKSPGMKYRHYAPNAQVHVWWGDEAKVRTAIQRFTEEHAGERVACLAPTEMRDLLPQSLDVWTPAPGELYDQALSREVYHQLRTFDRVHVSHVLVVGVHPSGYGAAVMNRLQKASEGRMYCV